jgi:hypothetical protein
MCLVPLDVSHYQQLSDDEILNLARDLSNLTDEAKDALNLEISRRNLSADDIQTYATETAILEDSENRQRQKLLSPNLSRNKEFFGRANFVHDDSSGNQQYDATLWFVVFWFPLIPLGAYRVRRKGGWWRNFLIPNIEVVAKLPLNWEQIFRTWLVAVSLLFAAILILPHIWPSFATLAQRLNHRK